MVEEIKQEFYQRLAADAPNETISTSNSPTMLR